LSLGNFPPYVGNQSEVELYFDIPSEDGVFGAAVMAHDTKLNSGMYFYVDYVKPPNKTSVYTVKVVAESLPIGGRIYKKEMPNYDLPGDD